jgi:hypothetical protein
MNAPMLISEGIHFSMRIDQSGYQCGGKKASGPAAAIIMNGSSNNWHSEERSGQEAAWDGARRRPPCCRTIEFWKIQLGPGWMYHYYSIRCGTPDGRGPRSPDDDCSRGLVSALSGTNRLEGGRSMNAIGKWMIRIALICIVTVDEKRDAMPQGD